MLLLHTNRARSMSCRASSLFSGFLLGCVGLAPPACGAQDFSGILETQGAYSAIFRLSPDSSDLVGHLFRNDSVLGRRIMDGCLVGMPCVLDDVRTRDFDSASGFRLGFADKPAGWTEVISAQRPRVGSAIDEYQTEVRTRYGLVAADSASLTLLWRGKPLWPAGAGSFSVIRHFTAWEGGELLLVQNTGGLACPALYRFVKVSQHGAVASPEFGTCSDRVYPFMQDTPQDPQSSKGREATSSAERVVVRMVGYVGPFGTEAAQHQAGRTLVEYRFSAGQLTQVGSRAGQRNTVAPAPSTGGLR